MQHLMHYGTNLMQHRIYLQVLVYHSPSARTRLSASFSGLELRLKLKRKLKRAVRQTKINNKGVCFYILYVHTNLQN